jgi:hypothetical protein
MPATGPLSRLRLIRCQHATPSKPPMIAHIRTGAAIPQGPRLIR